MGMGMGAMGTSPSTAAGGGLIGGVAERRDLMSSRPERIGGLFATKESAVAGAVGLRPGFDPGASVDRFRGCIGDNRGVVRGHDRRGDNSASARGPDLPRIRG